MDDAPESAPEDSEPSVDVAASSAGPEFTPPRDVTVEVPQPPSIAEGLVEDFTVTSEESTPEVPVMCLTPPTETPNDNGNPVIIDGENEVRGKNSFTGR